MKKILVTVAVAAMAITSAFGGACGEALPKEEAWVYKWTFTGKTTTGEAVKAVRVSTACGEFGGDVACAVRVPASLKIEGYMGVCSPGCGTETFAACSEANEVFWQKKPFKASLAGGVATDVCNIIGRNKKQVEIAGQANFDKFVNGTIQEGSYTFTYAGIGKYDLKNGRIKAVKGTFAGYLTQPHAVSVDLCTTAGFWDCSTLALTCEGSSVVTGKFKVKYSKSASKKYLRGVFPKIPSWATALNN